MANQVPEKLIDYRVYRDGVDLVGMADVDLPDIDPLSDKIKGAGIAGEIDSPTLGHYGSMVLKIKWRTLVKPILFLSQQKTHALDIRGASQVTDAGTGTIKVVPIKIAVRCTSKKTGLGKFDVSSKTDSSNEFEVSYIKIDIDGETVVEIDKFNYKSVIDGEDALADVKKALGME